MIRPDSLVRFPPEEFDALRSALVLYQSALRIVQTHLTNLNEYYMSLPEANPIEHIKYRLKSLDSMAAKLDGRGLPLTAQSATEHLTDIAGARIICSYAKDIVTLANIVQAHDAIDVVTAKDYVSAPKPSGYRSYHLVVRVKPGGVFGDQSCPVEIQLRTEAMDFWASLEHKARYKYNGDIPDHLSRELHSCAEKIHELDERLYLIHELIEMINA